MTRKCIMCKSKNYKNSHSFFSAPKNSETRRLWEEAINIKDYTVNEDTYVCSKHFKKDDIITHWVSGVPPQVITIKYKKCRLRPGAVPLPISSTNDSQTDISLESQNNAIILDGKKYFIESKKKDSDTNSKTHKIGGTLNESLNCNLEDEIYEYIPEDSQEPEESDIETSSTRASKRQKLVDKHNSDKEQMIHSSNQNAEIMLIDCTNINVNDAELNENKINDELNFDDTAAILTYLPKKTYIRVKKKGLTKTVQSNDVCMKNEQMMSSSINWQVDPMHDAFQIDEINELNENFNKTDFVHTIHPSQEIIYCDNNSMAFEDFLEIYNEVSLPSSWFASMITKGHDITIVYCCMNISSTGMPYVEKKVFLNNNMVLRCGVFNKEINVTTFVKNEENFIIRTLNDIEDFIKEFNQTLLCPGIVGKDFVDNSNTAVITLDGNTWRHSQCSIILSEGQTCLQCASLIKSEPS